LLSKDYTYYQPTLTDATSLATRVIIKPLHCSETIVDACIP